METLKFKVGDNVRVRSLEWYNDNKNNEGNIYGPYNEVNFINSMARYCGQVFQIKEIVNGSYMMHDNIYCWKEWMLEDEVVKEKRVLTNEHIDLKEMDMETKELTKEEVFKYLGSTKILCTSTEETAQVQEKLFELGVEWMLQGRKICKDKYLLFINERQQLKHSSDIDYWIKDINRRIEPGEILAIQIKEEKTKSDPKSLRPFDKVLVRNATNEIWRARFFDLYVDGLYETASGENWVYCIPYNEETKHLHYNANMEPEFYKI